MTVLGLEPTRRILLATVGLVPQVVTETLYALVHQEQPPFVPTEIHVITTADGCERTRLWLLDPSRAMLARFADEFGVPEVATALTLSRLHVISDQDGEPFADTTSKAANDATADTVARLVRHLTSDPASTLHVSIAGGRKTMGFLLGSALSLYGRPQDRLSHVVVEPAAFEKHPDFFYPPRVPTVLRDLREQNRPIDTRDARITLAEIPYVRLRHGLPHHLLDGNWTYSETVARAQELVRPPRLVIDLELGLLSCGGIQFRLTPVNFAFYAWLAERRRELGDSAGIHYRETDPREMLRAHVQRYEIPAHVKDKLRAQLNGDEIPRDLIELRKNRVNEALTSTLGQDDTAYHVSSVGRIAGTQYERIGLSLDPSAISFDSLEIVDTSFDADEG